MDLLTSAESKEWKYFSDHNGAGTSMVPSLSTDPKDLQHTFDNCVRRSINHPENATITEKWPHLFYHERERVVPTLASMPIETEEMPDLRRIEEKLEEQQPRQPRLLNNGPWEDLPGDKADLNKLIHWLHRHDGEWLANALWLRYTKVAKVVYSNRSYVMTHRDRVNEGLIKDTKYFPEEEPPIPYNILPAMQPCDKVDRLSALPHDLRVEILSYLLRPNFKMRLGEAEIVDHPLNRVVLVSRSWRDQVDAFCGHELLVWKQRVRRCEMAMFLARHDEIDSWVEWRALTSYTSCARMEYVFRTRTCCALCGGNKDYVSFSTGLGMMWCRQCEHHEVNPYDPDDDACRYR
jgi:hypothetical protein